MSPSVLPRKRFGAGSLEVAGAGAALLADSAAGLAAPPERLVEGPADAGAASAGFAPKRLLCGTVEVSAGLSLVVDDPPRLPKLKPPAGCLAGSAGFVDAASFAPPRLPKLKPPPGALGGSTAAAGAEAGALARLSKLIRQRVALVAQTSSAQTRDYRIRNPQF